MLVVVALATKEQGMLGELVAEVAGGLLRGIGRMLAEIVFHLLGEVIIRGTGYLLCRPFKPDVPPDGQLVLFVGFVFWLSLVIGGLVVCR